MKFFMIPVATRKLCIEAAKDMAEEYRQSLREAKAALADRDRVAYELHKSHMDSFRLMAFISEQDGHVSKVRDCLSTHELFRPFGIITL